MTLQKSTTFFSSIDNSTNIENNSPIKLANNNFIEMIIVIPRLKIEIEGEKK